MKSYTGYLWFNTKKLKEIVHITPKIEEIVKKSGIKEGFCLISAMHVTAAVYVNDNEGGIIQDIMEWLERIAPFKKNYKHHLTGETNADAHLKSLLMHQQVIVPVTEGKLDLGPWQSVFYAEFDGKRDKRVVVKIIGE